MKSKGAALIALTGDKKFLERLRERALEDGFGLNEFGLWRFHLRDKDSALEDNLTIDDATQEAPPAGHWEMLPSDTEEQIMSALATPFVQPERRNFSFITRGTKAR